MQVEALEAGVSSALHGRATRVVECGDAAWREEEGKRRDRGGWGIGDSLLPFRHLHSSLSCLVPTHSPSLIEITTRYAGQHSTSIDNIASKEILVLCP